MDAPRRMRNIAQPLTQRNLDGSMSFSIALVDLPISDKAIEAIGGHDTMSLPIFEGEMPLSPVLMEDVPISKARTHRLSNIMSMSAPIFETDLSMKVPTRLVVPAELIMSTPVFGGEMSVAIILDKSLSFSFPVFDGIMAGSEDVEVVVETEETESPDNEVEDSTREEEAVVRAAELAAYEEEVAHMKARAAEPTKEATSVESSEMSNSSSVASIACAVTLLGALVMMS